MHRAERRNLRTCYEPAVDLIGRLGVRYSRIRFSVKGCVSLAPPCPQLLLITK